MLLDRLSQAAFGIEKELPAGDHTFTRGQTFEHLNDAAFAVCTEAHLPWFKPSAACGNKGDLPGACVYHGLARHEYGAVGECRMNARRRVHARTQGQIGVRQGNADDGGARLGVQLRLDEDHFPFQFSAWNTIDSGGHASSQPYEGKILGIDL